MPFIRGPPLPIEGRCWIKYDVTSRSTHVGLCAHMSAIFRVSCYSQFSALCSYSKPQSHGLFSLCTQFHFSLVYLVHVDGAMSPDGSFQHPSVEVSFIIKSLLSVFQISLQNLENVNWQDLFSTTNWLDLPPPIVVPLENMPGKHNFKILATWFLLNVDLWQYLLSKQNFLPEAKMNLKGPN